MKAYGNDYIVQMVNTCTEKELSVGHHNPASKRQKNKNGRHSNSSNEGAKNKYVIETSMSLKGGEAETVFIFGLDVVYSMDHFTRNRQLKLLYVALSRAKNTIHLYLNYDTDAIPPLMHFALEGSALKNRFVSKRKAADTCSMTGRTIPYGRLSMSVECSGLNKENSGGLCGSQLEAEVFGEFTVATNLNTTQHVNMDDISRHLVSKSLIYEGICIWTYPKASEHTISTCASRAVRYVEHSMTESQVRWDVNMAILSHKTAMQSMNESAVQFGLGMLAALLGRCLCMEEGSEWPHVDLPVDPSDLYDGKSAALRRSVAADAVGFLEGILDRLSARLGDVSLKLNCLEKMHFGSGNGAFFVQCRPDLVFHVKRFTIPVVLCATGPDIPRHSIVRAGLCASILKVKQCAIVNATTGRLLMVRAIDVDQMECVAKGSILSKYVCNWSSQCVPVSLIPGLVKVSSVIVLSTVKQHKDRAVLCALLMSNYTVVAAEKWEVPRDGCELKGQILSRTVKEWIDTRAREECVLMVPCDEDTRDALGELLSPGRSLSLSSIFALMADTLSSTGSHPAVEAVLRVESLPKFARVQSLL